MDGACAANSCYWVCSSSPLRRHRLICRRSQTGVRLSVRVGDFARRYLRSLTAFPPFQAHGRPYDRMVSARTESSFSAADALPRRFGIVNFSTNNGLVSLAPAVFGTPALALQLQSANLASRKRCQHHLWDPLRRTRPHFPPPLRPRHSRLAQQPRLNLSGR